MLAIGLVSKLHFKMTMMSVDESSDLMGEVAEVAYHFSIHNCRGVITSLIHLGERQRERNGKLKN